MKVIPSIYSGGAPITIADGEIEDLVEKTVDLATSTHTDKAGNFNEGRDEDTVHNESRSRSMQSELRLTGGLQQYQLQSQLNYLGKGSQGPQVSRLQKELNDWRAMNGKPPIAADGIFGKDTEAAVKEYQQAKGLKADGLAGPLTKERLTAEVKLTANPTFQKLSDHSKYHAVNKLLANPTNETHVKNVHKTMEDVVGMENDPAFQKLNLSVQDGFKTSMFDLSGNADGRKDLKDLALSERFANLTLNQQDQVQKTLLISAGKEGAEAVPAFLNLYLKSPSCDGKPDEAFMNSMLKTAEKLAPDAFKMWEFNELLESPQFVAASTEDRLAMMNAFSGNTGLQI